MKKWMSAMVVGCFGGLALSACGGSSETADDDEAGGRSGSAGTGGSGATGGKGGSASGGTGTGGTGPTLTGYGQNCGCDDQCSTGFCNFVTSSLAICTEPGVRQVCGTGICFSGLSGRGIPCGASGSGGAGTGGTGTGGTGTGGSGGSEPMPSACDITPCGGDPAGTWSVESLCVALVDDPFAEEPACVGAFTVDVAASGSYSFDAGTVSWNLTTTANGTMTIDDACASALAGATLTAAAFCPGLQTAFTDSGDFSAVSCTAGTLCVCDVATAPENQVGSDTYTVDGTNLADSTGIATGFCVDGDELSLQSLSGSATSSMILTRQ